MHRGNTNYAHLARRKVNPLGKSEGLPERTSQADPELLISQVLSGLKKVWAERVSQRKYRLTFS